MVGNDKSSGKIAPPSKRMSRKVNILSPSFNSIEKLNSTD